MDMTSSLEYYKTMPLLLIHTGSSIQGTRTMPVIVAMNDDFDDVEEEVASMFELEEEPFRMIVKWTHISDASTVLNENNLKSILRLIKERGHVNAIRIYPNRV